MSKSKGNVNDPLALIDEYGADALRFTLAAMAAMGRDIKLSTQRVEGYRNFATKLWNAARFAEMNGCATVAKFDPRRRKETLNRWIAHEIAKAAVEVTEAIEAYRFNDAAAAAVYRFVWNIYCDWYLEPRKAAADRARQRGEKAKPRRWWPGRGTRILKLLHPFMPFVTEELWMVTGKHDALLTLDKMASAVKVLPTTKPKPKSDGDRSRHRHPIVRAEMNITAAIPLVLAALLPPRARRVPSAGPSSSSGWRGCRTSRPRWRPRRKARTNSSERGEVAALPLMASSILPPNARGSPRKCRRQMPISRASMPNSARKLCRACAEEVVEEEKEKKARGGGRPQEQDCRGALERLKGRGLVQGIEATSVTRSFPCESGNPALGPRFRGDER